MTDLSRRLQGIEEGQKTYQELLRQYAANGDEFADYIDKLESMVAPLADDEIKALIVAITFVIGACDPNKIPPNMLQTLQSFTDDLRRLLDE
jgi:hypothetical protein